MTLFVAVAGTGTNRVMTSPDGITWTSQVSPTNRSWYTITRNTSIFVAAGTGSSGDIMTSPDGITWTIRVPPITGAWYGSAWNGTVFVLVGTNRIVTSPDGITWTSQVSPTIKAWRGIAWNGSIFVAVSSDGSDNQVMTSPDGITWTSRTTPTGSATSSTWVQIAWNGTLFVAVATSGTERVMTSPDGITWTTRTPGEAFNSWAAIAWNGTMFAAVSGEGRVMTSPDGITWNIQVSASLDMAWSGIAWNGTVFAVVSSSGAGTPRVMTSPDGITWTLRTASVNVAWYGIASNIVLPIPTALPPPVLFVHDTFTGPSLLLTARAGEIGAAWAAPNNGIAANPLRDTRLDGIGGIQLTYGGGINYWEDMLASGVPPGAHYFAEAVFDAAGAATGNLSQVSIFLRAVRGYPDPNAIEVALEPVRTTGGGQSKLWIRDYAANTISSILLGPVYSGVHTLRAEVVGSEVRAYIDGALKLTFTAVAAAVGRVGLNFGSDGATNTTGVVINEFRAGALAPPPIFWTNFIGATETT